MDIYKIEITGLHYIRDRDNGIVILSSDGENNKARVCASRLHKQFSFQSGSLIEFEDASSGETCVLRIEREIDGWSACFQDENVIASVSEIPVDSGCWLLGLFDDEVDIVGYRVSMESDNMWTISDWEISI